MNVPPRRTPKIGAKFSGRESNSFKTHGSHFDALQNIIKDSRAETMEANVDGIPNTKVTTKINSDARVKCGLSLKILKVKVDKL